ncbi:MAG: PAS domain-containing protein, partial [Chloroflexota bacterium]
VIVTRDISLQMQTEQDLRKSEERFSRVFHGNPAVQLISRVDNGRILDVNESCCRLVGCDRDELIGRNATELNFWADSAEQQQKIQQTRRSGVQGPFEVNVRHRSGEMHTIIVTSEPVEFKGLNALISTAIDITQHKKSEKALRESEQRFSTIFNYSPIAMVVSRLSDGLMIDANTATQTLLGYSREEMIGHTAAEMQTWDNLQERPALVEQLRSQKRVTNFETVARMKSGARVNVLISAQVVVIDQEELLLGQIIDITQRKKDDEALRHSEAKYLALFQKSAVPAALTKMPEGIFVDVNEAFENAFGYSRQDILGRTSVEIGIIGVAERQKTYEEIERFGFVHKNEKHLITKSGAARDCLINVNPAKIQGEDYVITTIFDVTERNRAEEALRQAHEELELRVQQRTAELTQANAALQASKATLLGFYDSAPFMMGVAELDGDKTAVVSANRETATFLAMQPIDLPGRTGIELGTPGDLEHLFVENFKRCQREGVPVRFEYNYPNSSGERWLNVSVSFIGIGVTGHPQFSFVVEDITEHKHAEIQKDAALEKLRENEARLRQVLDSTQDAIFAIDLEYRFLVNNRSHQQALIESGGHLFQVGELILSPDYPPEVVSHWRAAYNRALNGDSFKMETNWPDASGQLHYSENNLAPLRDAAGAIMGVLVVVHDITERKRAEEALQQINEILEQRVSERTYELAASEQKFRELADSITDV